MAEHVATNHRGLYDAVQAFLLSESKQSSHCLENLRSFKISVSFSGYSRAERFTQKKKL